MTQLALGRVFDGLDVAPSEVTQDGRRVVMSGPIYCSTYDKLRAARERFAALTTTQDEVAIPVTFTEDASVEGWYYVRGGSWQQPSYSPTSRVAFWAVELERAGDRADTVQLEVHSVHAVRANQNGIDTTDYSGTNGWFDWVPGTATDWYNSSLATSYTRSADAGESARGIPASSGEYIATYSVDPSLAYYGACSIHCNYGGVSELVGGKGGEGAFGTGAWVVSNGIVRVKQHSSDNSAFVVEVLDGGSWVTMHSNVGWRHEIDYGGGSTASWNINTATVSVLRNSPDVAAIRLQVLNSTYAANFGRLWIDLTVRRGDLHVCGVVQVDSLGSGGGVHAIEPTSSVAATALSTSAGLQATSNDSNGNRAVWACAGAVAVTQNTTTGRIIQSSGGGTTGRKMPFMVGCELDGSSAATPNAAADVLLQWYDGRGTEQRPVRR